MLKRIYIDNYKCLVNFELSIGKINLLLGPNGGGKSTVFEVLRKIRSIVNADSSIRNEFEYSSLTRWQSSLIQKFELELEQENNTYKYELTIEHDKKEQKPHIKSENLWSNDHPLFSAEKGEAQIFREDSTEGDRYLFSPDSSLIGTLSPHFNMQIHGFRQCMRNLLIVQIDPRIIVDVIKEVEPYPSIYFDNYAAWYSFLSRDQGWLIDLTKALKEVLPGFKHFKFVEAGEGFSVLKVIISKPDDDRSFLEYRLEELSDGQRAMIYLYTLLIAASKEQYTLCIDEPENFLALPEIQPWLIQLYDSCSEGKTQALLISHHPELINYLLASPIGYWFERQNNLAARVKQIRAEDDGGLPISDLIARGWLHE